jgi:threonine dehydrogenase-like Zn-dependent dehydrogenase
MGAGGGGVTTTRAFLLARDLTMSVGSRELSETGPDEALIRVELAGLCGSDLHVMRTGDWVVEWPATLGHEIFGRVKQAPSDSALERGAPVVADSRIACGHCAACRGGRSDFCTQLAFVGEARPGGFADYCVLPLTLLHRVPDTLEGAQAVLAEPLAVTLHALSHLRSEPQRVAVIGHGPIGALIHIELRRRFPDCEIAIAEPAELRASLARELGSSCATTAADLPAGSFDTVIDAAGYRGSLTDALRLCAPEAHLVIIALSEHPVPVKPMDIVERRVHITGSNAFRDELDTAIELLAAEPPRYAPIVTEEIELDDLPRTATRQLARPDAVKVLVRP